MYKKILVPLDGSTFAEQALPRAGALAAAHHASVVLVMVHHVPTPNFAPDGVWLDVSGLEAELRTQQQRYLEKIAAELREKFSIVVNVVQPLELGAGHHPELATLHGIPGAERFSVHHLGLR